MDVLLAPFGLALAVAPFLVPSAFCFEKGKPVLGIAAASSWGWPLLLGSIGIVLTPGSDVDEYAELAGGLIGMGLGALVGLALWIAGVVGAVSAANPGSRWERRHAHPPSAGLPPPPPPPPTVNLDTG